MTLRLGVIGVSDGNGHPWSWSAICNGYDSASMATCPYPAIPAYLGARRFPEDQLPGVRVSHVWTQERSVSEHIARASLVSTVVDDPLDMVGAVDGILLARDDAENHEALAGPFLEAGIPVYVDKPLAIDVATARRLFEREQRPGHLFSCTALRFADELRLDGEARARLGEVRHVTGVVPKGWSTYAVHVIEPALALLSWPSGDVRATAVAAGEVHLVHAAWPSGHSATFQAMGRLAAPMSLHVVGTSGATTLTFTDAFSAFRSALAAFCESILEQSRTIPVEETLAVVELVEQGAIHA